MDLEFNKQELHHLNCVLNQVRSQEETGETVVPDSYPDIGRIVHSYAEPIIRNKECRENCVVISGGIKGGVIYVPENNTEPRDLQFYLPFTTKLESQQITEEAEITCTCKIDSVDGRVINSRKAMLRVNLSCNIVIYESSKELLFEYTSSKDAIECLENTYVFHFPLETSEKSFVIGDTLELPVSSPPAEHILKQCCRLEIVDKKTVGNKGVFKGNLICKILYISDDKRLYSHEWQLPFSQYCEFKSDYDQEEMTLLPTITGYDIEADNQDPSHMFQITLHALVQSVVFGEHTMKIIEDAYGISEELLPEWHQYDTQSLLDLKKERQTLRHRLNKKMDELIDTDVYLGHPRTEQASDVISIIAPVSYHLLGIDDNGELTEIVDSTGAEQRYGLAENVQCMAQAEMTGSITCSLFSDGTEVACDVRQTAGFYMLQELKTLCGGRTEVKQNNSKRPSLIIKKIEKECDLWSIAKENHARVNTICAVNHLKDKTLAEDQMLLIPVG